MSTARDSPSFERLSSRAAALTGIRTVDPISEAVSDLQTQIREFSSDERARILHVLANPEHASLVTKTFRSEEWNPENRSPFSAWVAIA